MVVVVGVDVAVGAVGAVLVLLLGCYCCRW